MIIGKLFCTVQWVVCVRILARTVSDIRLTNRAYIYAYFCWQSVFRFGQTAAFLLLVIRVILIIFMLHYMSCWPSREGFS